MSDPVFGKASSKQETKPEKPGKSRFWIKFFLLLVVVGALGAAGGLIVLDRIIPAKFAEAGPAKQTTLVTIEPGTGLNAIAYQLADAGLIEHANWFRLKGKMTGAGISLKAGEYSIVAQASLDDIFAQMQAGQVIQHGITIAEGLTSRAILQTLRDNEVLRGAIETVPPEGSLLPETYHVVRGTSRSKLLERMARDQSELLDQLWAGRDKNLPITTPQQAVILASIVEKETGLQAEHGRVAAVFINRMRRGMRLESDPTILYGLNGGVPLGRGLRRSEIDRKTAWNTYQIRGLPPTPICNPGRAALYAVLHPAQTRDLYFVADGSGGHVFARSYARHLVNVANWRKLERQRKRAKQE
ncbi:MAG: aminodeoxychorismate lyase [Robiginitomaculum sp.]|nr:MAG: aminodeoxychorismate lyase [Robiginitomaculum sp.]